MKLTFEQEKETKNTIRFQEVPEAGKPPVIGTLYIQKWKRRYNDGMRDEGRETKPNLSQRRMNGSEWSFPQRVFFSKKTVVQ